MNVEMGTEAAQFPEKEYINGIFLAVYASILSNPGEVILIILVILFGIAFIGAVLKYVQLRKNIGMASTYANHDL
jgi:hypothetical protein